MFKFVDYSKIYISQQNAVWLVSFTHNLIILGTAKTVLIFSVAKRLHIKILLEEKSETVETGSIAPQVLSDIISTFINSSCNVQ